MTQATLPAQRPAQADHQHPRAMPNSVGSDALQADSVTSAAIAPDAVGSSEIAPNAVGSSEIATDAVGADELAADSVGNSELQDNAVAQANMQDNSVGTAELIAASVTDAKIESSFIRGIIDQQTLTVNEAAAHTVSGATDMVLNNVPVVQGHTYEIHFHSFEALTAAGNWVLEARVNGAVVGWLEIARDSGRMMDGSVYWVAPTTQATDDFTVFATEASAGGDLTLSASASNPRTLTITDLGVL